MWNYVFYSLAVIYLLYRWYVSRYDYFIQRNVPGPTPKFPFGNIVNAFLFKRNFVYDFIDIYEEYRKKASFVGYFEGRTPKLLITSPEIAKQILIKNFSNFHDNEFSNMIDKDSDPIFGRNPFILRGQEWKEKRAEITPAFTSNRLRALFPLVDEVLIRLRTYINKEIPAKQPFDAREVCAKFTTDVVSSCIFNADAESFTKEKPAIREMGRKLMDFATSVQIAFVLYALFPFLLKVHKISMIPKDVENFFTDLTRQALEMREKTKINRDDYLSFLIDLQKKKNLSQLEMASHSITFFTDGFETSSLAICYTLYELANNKRVQEKLRKQINEELYDANGKIIYDKMLEHEYLNQVFHEALRMHPVLGLYNRECTEEMVLEGNNGVKMKVEKGFSVYVPVIGFHYDPDFFEKPNEFYPERFDAANGGVKAFRDRGVFMPFGDGPRICLGERFAAMQSKAAIIDVLRNFELSVNDKTKRPLVLDPKGFLNVKEGGIWLDFKAIK